MSDFPADMATMVWDVVHGTSVIDVRCFISPPEATAGHATGVDALLSSKAILKEFFLRRSLAEPAAQRNVENLSSLSQSEIADLVWRRLFLEQSPLSETTRVVLTTLGLFGMAVDKRDLNLFRDEFAAMSAAERLERAFAIAKVEYVLYPVDSLAVSENTVKTSHNPRFKPVLSLNAMLGDWKESARHMRSLGFGVKGKVDEFAPLELRRFLSEQVNRLNPVAISYDWPGIMTPDSNRGGARLIQEAVLPLCAERGLAFCIAGANITGEACEDEPEQPLDIPELAVLWRQHPDVNFLFFPAGGNQLSAACREASRYGNLLLCGPDASLANPTALARFTRERLESCGSVFHACHSGAETVEELTGKWAHLRWTVGEALRDRYAELWRTGWRFTEEDVAADVKAILGGNAKTFLGL